MECVCRQDPKILPEPGVPEAPSDRAAFLHRAGPDVHAPQFGWNPTRVEAEENGGRPDLRKIGRVGDVFERLEKVEVALNEVDARQGDRMLAPVMCLTMFIR